MKNVRYETYHISFRVPIFMGRRHYNMVYLPFFGEFDPTIQF